MLEIVTVKALNDNYDYLVHDADTGRTAVVDVADAAPVLETLNARGWSLDEIWLTHHHWDHTDGVEQLRAATGAKVTGAHADAHRLPALDRAVATSETFDFAGHEIRILPADGHTVGHIAFYILSAGALFSGDSLMVMGCGRLFEGTPAQMWETISRFADLPDETLIYSGHEYTGSNIRFALSIDPDNGALHDRAKSVEATLAQGGQTVPAPLALERRTNPFLRANDTGLKRALGMEQSSDLEAFTEIRARKDCF